MKDYFKTYKNEILFINKKYLKCIFIEEGYESLLTLNKIYKAGTEDTCAHVRITLDDNNLYHLPICNFIDISIDRLNKLNNLLNF